MTDWVLVYDRFDPGCEGLREALCTLGNGVFATRGAAPEAEDDGIHYPGTYLAGGYDRLGTYIAGRLVENEDLVNMPNWLPLRLRLGGRDGDWFVPTAADILSFRQELDLRAGLLSREMRIRDRRGRRTRIADRRFVSLADRHIAALETTVIAENWSGPLTVLSALDGRVVNAGVARYRQLDGRHLRPLRAEGIDDETVLLQVETRQSGLRVAEAARTRIFLDGTPADARPRLMREDGFVGHEAVLDLERGVPVRVEKIVCLFGSRDRAISESADAAVTWIGRAGGFEPLFERHRRTWGHLWRRCDIRIEDTAGNAETAGIGASAAVTGREPSTALKLRLHVFHLLQTVSHHTVDLDAGVPARGLHGEAYRGHVFWDELFIFPYLNLRLPELTRALLRYRYRRLPEARRMAHEAGLRGAMYPWQSGSSGREESQRLHLNPVSGRWLPDNSRLQRHVGIAVAYTVWQYHQVTGDLEFLQYYGVEMICEIARFWAALAQFDPERRRYVIGGVMGPDEYHDAYPDADRPGLDNNAYTNIMVAWVMARAEEALGLLPPGRRLELCADLDLGEAEIVRWRDIRHRLFVPFHADGVISQFEGYERLAEFDWAGYRRRYGEIARLDRILESEGDSVNRYKASKQADVLMLFYLLTAEELAAILTGLGYRFDSEMIPRTVRYYQDRTSHGSTLSRIVHSWVLARADRPRAWRLFVDALDSDIADSQGGTTAEGIHLGAMAGSVDLLQRGFTGIETRGDVLRFNPCLPDALDRLDLPLRYRGHMLNVEVTHHRLTVACRPGTAPVITVALGGDERRLEAGGHQVFIL